MTTAFKVSQEIDIKRIRDLLCSAFEGGSNYWYLIDKVNYPPGLKSADYKEGGKGQPAGDYYHWSQLVPTQIGGSLLMTSKERDEINGAKKWLLDKAAIDRGLAVMADKYPRHFGDFIAENDDASTADVFLQCCLFGEVVYG